MKRNKHSQTRQERRKNQKKLQRFNLMVKGVITFNYAYKIGRLLELGFRLLEFFSNFF